MHSQQGDTHAPKCRRLLLAMLMASTLTACAGTTRAGDSSALLPSVTQPQAISAKIKHVIIVIQENRSFNNLFYGYPG